VSPARKAGRTKARRLRENRGIAADVPLPDVLALAEADLGLRVVILADLGDVAGAYLGNKRLVLLNGADAPVRLRFTLAHELCHHLFGDDAQPDTHAGLARPGHWIEVRANAFAAELLVPTAGLERWVAKRKLSDADLYEVVACALQFGVSAHVALFRLVDAGVAPDAETIRRQIEDGEHLPIAAYGEPYPDGLRTAVESLPRIPDELAGSVFVKVARGELTVAEAAARLRVGPDALRKQLAPLGVLPPA
jgi:Zn-dependent peptidase ImmA (M78 family)